MDLNFVGIQELVTRYLKALIEVATEKKLLKTLYEDFRKLELLVDTDKAQVIFKIHDSISQKNKIAEISTSLKLNKLSTKFLNVLEESGRYNLIPYCIKFFFREYNKLQHVKNVTITSAKELAKDEKNSLKDRITSLLKTNIECDFKVREELIGGLTVTLDSINYDFSINARMKYILDNSTNKIRNINF